MDISPAGASLHGAPGFWRAWAWCLREDWRLEMALLPSRHACWRTVSLCGLWGGGIDFDWRAESEIRWGSCQKQRGRKNSVHEKAFFEVGFFVRVPWAQIIWHVGSSVVTLLWKVIDCVLLLVGNMIYCCSICNCKNKSQTSGDLWRISLSSAWVYTITNITVNGILYQSPLCTVSPSTVKHTYHKEFRVT